MEALRVIFYGFLLMFCVDCAISGDDAVRNFLNVLGIEKDLEDLDARERAGVIGKAAELYEPLWNNEMKQKLEKLETSMAKLQQDFGVDGKSRAFLQLNSDTRGSFPINGDEL